VTLRCPFLKTGRKVVTLLLGDYHWGVEAVAMLTLWWRMDLALKMVRDDATNDSGWDAEDN
jgi:hypothetical protein